MFSCVVLSLRLQQETGTEIVRSQGTIGGKVTIAQASSSLISVTGVTGSVLPLDVFFFLAAKDHSGTTPDTGLSEVPMYAHAGRRLVQYSAPPSLHSDVSILLSLLVVVPHHSWFLPL